jgi:hypothetical protein
MPIATPGPPIHNEAMRAGLAQCIVGTLVVMGPAVVLADPPDSPVSAQFRAAVSEHGISATDPDHAGIWKAATPAEGAVRGEFANNDPIGLSAGVRIWADCSINWVDPDTRRRYCFSSATSLVVFLETPHSYLERAVKNWDGPAGAVADAPPPKR